MYLGSKVQGTTGSLSEIEHRIEKGNHAIRKHYAFWKGDKISKAHKIQAYRMYVTSVVMHGFEGWHLSDKAQAMINGFDIRFQVIITGFDYEFVAHNRQFHLLTYTRQRRFTFLGHTLRLHCKELAFQTLATYHTFLNEQPRLSRAFEGTVFMDFPSPRDFNLLVSTAKDRQKWRSLGDSIKITGGQNGRLGGARRSGRLTARPSSQLEDRVEWRREELQTWRRQ